MYQAQFEDLEIWSMKTHRHEPSHGNDKPDVRLHPNSFQREHHRVKPLGCYGKKTLDGDCSGHVLEEIGEFTQDQTGCTPISHRSLPTRTSTIILGTAKKGRRRSDAAMLTIR
ncbi:hypothetical protein OS493_017688 [Desmophyllum pertusum]|uniref:Uncharacterized protein n=1 Tax=Desmophyllum pertusum TaxID=174260 RepID=A0A9W9ZCG0_9CNID|nr:hypothetical protein OS493_017688 [Desmophyllum pertusum]